MLAAGKKGKVVIATTDFQADTEKDSLQGVDLRGVRAPQGRKPPAR